MRDVADKTPRDHAAAPAATSSTAAYHSSTPTGLFAGLKPTFRYIIYAAIGVLGAIILGLCIWGLCACCKRRRAKPTDQGYVPKKPTITHHVPALPLSTARGAAPGAGGGGDKWAEAHSIDTWVDPPSPYEEKYRGGAEERWEMAVPVHGADGSPPGWSAPSQYDNYASHSALSFAGDDTPLVKPLTRLPTAQPQTQSQQPNRSTYVPGSRPPIQRAPSSSRSHGGGGVAQTYSRAALERNPSSASGGYNQRNRYTQQQVEGYGQDWAGQEYARDGREAWEALPPPGREAQAYHGQDNWI